MAKKTTTTKSIASDVAEAVPPAAHTDHAPPADPPAPAKRKTAKKAPPAKAALAKVPTARKKTAKPIVRAGFSNEDVALRAYFIEAERQLRKEHGSKA
jgi:hypothetical protein